MMMLLLAWNGVMLRAYALLLHMILHDDDDVVYFLGWRNVEGLCPVIA